MGVDSRWPLPGHTPLRDRLVAAYVDPRRGYHDLRHLGEVLARLDELEFRGETFDRLPVRLAAWFHDSVYDGVAGAAERSAMLAADELRAAGLDTAVVEEVVRLVLLTEGHRPKEDDPNGQALVDADLAILASPPERYAEYVADVRREYAALSDAAFDQGRRAVLTDLAAKPSLFHTDHARTHWEPVAQSNLARELAPASTDRPGAVN